MLYLVVVFDTRAQGNVKRALLDFERAYELEPDNKMALNFAGLCLTNMGQCHEVQATTEIYTWMLTLCVYLSPCYVRRFDCLSVRS